MKKLQRDLIYAQLELMHLAADDLLAIGTGRRPRKQPRVDGSQFPVLQPPGMKLEQPIFTSEAAREAWEREHDNGQDSI